MREGEPSERVPTDPSLSSELVRERLAEFLTSKGYSYVEARKVALYLAEGTRHVLHLLKILTKAGGSTDKEIQVALGAVLDSSITLEKAKRMLLHRDDQGSSGPKKHTE